MDNKKLNVRNGVFSKQDQSKKDIASGGLRSVPKNARRREAKGSHQQAPENQLRNLNNNSGQAQHRNNNERRSKWSRARPQAPGLRPEPDDDLDDDLLPDLAEWDSVLVPGSKKHNLNHLLNFHYTPRDRDVVRPQSKRDQQLAQKKSSVFFDKTRFLQANCVFVVKDSGDYKSHLINPDSLVDWTNIEEVIIRSAEEPQCPICLFPPVAAKMTKCGHVYCWPCMLHYLALSDKEWRKCPICYDAVRMQDLRSTVAWPYHEYQLHETIDFQLMCRRKGEIIAEPYRVDQNGPGKRLPHLFDIRENQVCHSKLILANKTEVASILQRERAELEAQMETDGPMGFNCPETMFISQAMEQLELREKEVANSPINKESVEEPTVREQVAEDQDDHQYFYQAVDGQNLFMHSINLRMLQMEYGSLAQCPAVLTGQIVQRDIYSLSESLRNRSKYLQHLPLTSIFAVVELTFKRDLISPGVIKQFAEETAQRRRDRQRKARDALKHERKINHMNQVQMGEMMQLGREFVRNDSDFCRFLEDVNIDHEAGAVGGEVVGSEVDASPKPFSFAEMLQCSLGIEKEQSQLWPTLENNNKKPSTMNSVAGPSRQSKPIASQLEKHFPNLLDTINVEDEDINNSPEAAAPLPAIKTPLSPIPVGEVPARKTTKRGNKKKTLLFSTDMNFKRN